MAVHNILPSLPPLFSSHVFLCVFLSLFIISLVFFGVLVIDILANGWLYFTLAPFYARFSIYHRRVYAARSAI